MRCAKCGTENTEQARFCQGCGSSLSLVCANCGAELPPQAKFCLQCGEKVAAAPPVEAALGRLQRLVPKEFAERLLATRGEAERERRRVTILFSDVKGSTAMAERLDPEEVMEIMDEAFDVLIEPIYRHEGTLARLMGDAILAFFGAPIAHEDDPERALRAALDILAGAQAYAQKLERERGIQGFNVRVGINTGLVVVGEVGSDLRVEYTAMGDAVNLAARMEQNAPVGGILITGDTYQHVRGQFEVRPLEPLLVKGKAEAVQAYQVLRALRRGFYRGGRGVEGVQVPMIGRGAELARLQAAFEGLVGGEVGTQALTVVGEAGVGKSRLLYEFEGWLEERAFVSESEVECLRGRATPMMVHAPYGVLRDLFALRFNILESDSAAQVQAKFEAGMAPYVEREQAQLVGHLVGLGFGDTRAVRNLADSAAMAPLALAYLMSYFRALAKERPVMLLLEDLHWADEPSLDFIKQLVGELSSQGLLLIGLARPSLYERLPEWGQDDPYQRLELKPLTEADSRALVEAILERVEDLPQGLRELIVGSAEGNPFYVEELVMMLIGDGVIEVEGEVWRVEMERLKEVRVPGTLAGVLQARLDGLPEEEKGALQRASVVGRQFWDEVVGWMGEQEGGAPELLQALSRRQLVYPQRRSAFAGAGEYLFKHAILRDVTYETVLLKLRRVYHRRVAEWLEGNCGERLEEYAGVIAGHYEAARDADKAVDWLLRAGQAAYGQSAFRDALSIYERALALAPESDLGLRGRLLIQIGGAYSRQGDLGQSQNYLLQGLELARQVSDFVSMTTALSSLSWLASAQGRIAEACDYRDQTLQAAQQSGERSAIANALMRMADHQEDFDVAIGYLEDGLALYRELGMRSREALCLMNMGIGYESQDIHQLADDRYKDSLEIYRELGDRWGVANCLINLGCVRIRVGDYREALRLEAEGLQISQDIGDRESAAICLENMGVCALALEEYEKAGDYFRQGLPEALAVGILPVALNMFAGMAHVLAWQGDYPRSAELLGAGMQHPARLESWQEIAEPLLERLRAEMTEEALQAALARGSELQLGEIIDDLVAQQIGH